MKKPKVLVSSCLCGIPCRYDMGSCALSQNTLSRLKSSFSLVAACPELLGALPSPRCPAEIVQGLDLVKASNGEDFTKNFKLGAQQALNICKNYGIRMAILKSKSPSCGKGNIYDGTFSGKLIEANGMTCDLLLKNGIKVMDEAQVEASSQGEEKIYGT